MNQKLISCFAIALCMVSSVFCLQAQNKAGFVQIFDGKSMKGWDADTTFWKVKDHSFVGEVTPSTPIKTNTFLIWRGGLPANFEFKASYRISPEGNSGVNYRSEELPDIKYALKGYQADIDGGNVYTGQNYEERGRGFLAKRGEIALLKTDKSPTITGSIGNSDSLKSKIKVGDWNEVHIIVNNNHMQHYINGILMSDVTDEDLVKRKMKGLLGLQVHVMPFMKVEYRNLYLKQL
ncbi:MAG: DUF1080 domain-containing protein [Chitinophagia bacterium]|jgi:Domain of Unknown Function (DUF1080)